MRNRNILLYNISSKWKYTYGIIEVARDVLKTMESNCLNTNKLNSSIEDEGAPEYVRR